MRHRILSLLLVLSASTVVFSQGRALTRDDTLRGSITPARAWWDLNYYHLNIAVHPESQLINGSVTITYHVLQPNQVLQIDLQEPLIIEKIVQDGQSVAFKKDGRAAYLVTLKKKQLKGKTESIVITYSGKPQVAKNPPWQGGVQWQKDQNGKDFIATSCQGLGASVWWPCKDHMYDEPDSVLISITVPPGLTDVSNGRLRKVDHHRDSTKTFHWFVGNPISNYGINMNVGDYTHYTDTLHGEKGTLDLDFYMLSYNIDKAKAQFPQAKKMLKAFEYWFGPYPFYEDGYKLVEAPYLGMEHQSSVTYGNGFKNGYLGRDLSGTGWGLKWDFIIIHESGHEWFANNITYRDMADMWIHESFTNYSETLFTEFYYGKEAGTEYVNGTRKNIQNDRPIIGVYNVNRGGSGDMYYKGGNMLHTIRHSMGNDVLFRDILRGLNKTFYHQTVTTQQIEGFISEKAKWNYGPVFDQYLRTVQIPTLEYYFDGGNAYFRWINCVKGFNMPLSLGSDVSPLRITPNEKWQHIAVAENLKAWFDAITLEKMYYIKVTPVTKP